MYNGSFGSIHDFLPLIGYKTKNELNENRSRQDQGLDPLVSRMAEATDLKSLNQNVYAPDAFRVTANITIGTSADQIPIAPGKLIREWSKNGRNHRSYKVSNESPFNWHLASGRFEENDSKVEGVDITIMPYEEHPFNTRLYKEAIHEAVRFTKEHLGDYPYQEVRLFEIPYYQDDFNTYTNSIAISEKEGWYADVSDIKEQAYIFQSTASQIFKHWVQENMNIADVQGAHMLSKALPEALGLLLTKEKLGDGALEVMLKKKHDFYAKEKNNEPNTEPPLLYADGIEYLEAYSGAEILYKAIAYMGAKKFISVLKEFAATPSTENVTFKDFYGMLKPLLSHEIQNDIEKV
jgi:hypothetical protein